MIRIITDSAADFEPEELTRLGIDCVPLNVAFGDKEYQENINLTKNEFYRMLESEKELPKTSQPAPYTFECILREAKEAGDEAVVITISSALSGTFQNAVMVKDMLDYENCSIVDSRNAAAGQRLLAERAATLRDEGKNALEIAGELEHLRQRVTLYACIDTLEYLYKGGRISAAANAIGTLANLKPVIHVSRDGQVELASKSPGMRRGMNFICRQLGEAEPEPDYPVYVMYTNEREKGEMLAEYLQKCGYDIPPERIINVGAAIGSHIGPGACGLAYISRKQKTNGL